MEFCILIRLFCSLLIGLLNRMSGHSGMSMSMSPRTQIASATLIILELLVLFLLFHWAHFQRLSMVGMIRAGLPTILAIVMGLLQSLYEHLGMSMTMWPCNQSFTTLLVLTLLAFVFLYYSADHSQQAGTTRAGLTALLFQGSIILGIMICYLGYACFASESFTVEQPVSLIRSFCSVIPQLSECK